MEFAYEIIDPSKSEVLLAYLNGLRNGRRISYQEQGKCNLVFNLFDHNIGLADEIDSSLAAYGAKRLVPTEIPKPKFHGREL